MRYFIDYYVCLGPTMAYPASKGYNQKTVTGTKLRYGGLDFHFSVAIILE